jgi:hypothetical protein
LSKSLPCPNPDCKHVFAASEAVGVAALICPGCGGVFQVKGRHAAEPLPIVSSTPRTAQASLHRKWRPIVWLVAGSAVAIGLTLVMAAVNRSPPARAARVEVFRSVEHNYSVRLPGPPWQRDDDVAKRLGGVLAFRRDNPTAEVVLAVRESPKAPPSPGELRETAFARLRQYHVSDLRFEDKSAGASFGGKPAGRAVFQGQIDDTPVSGEVHYLTHQGAAYWLYRWCPAADVETAAADLADVAGRFSVLDFRPEWRPQRRIFSGGKMNYTLTAEGDRWSKAPYPPESYDPISDLALLGRAKEDAAPQAQLLVLLLPPNGGAPVERAKAHLLARQKEVYPESTATELGNAAIQQADDAAVMRVDNTKDRARFVIYRAIVRPSHLVIVFGECDFVKRDVWEDDMRKLAASFQARD